MSDKITTLEVSAMMIAGKISTGWNLVPSLEHKARLASALYKTAAIAGRVFELLDEDTYEDSYNDEFIAAGYKHPYAEPYCLVYRDGGDAPRDETGTTVVLVIDRPEMPFRQFDFAVCATGDSISKQGLLLLALGAVFVERGTLEAVITPLAVPSLGAEIEQYCQEASNEVLQFLGAMAHGRTTLEHEGATADENKRRRRLGRPAKPSMNRVLPVPYSTTMSAAGNRSEPQGGTHASPIPHTRRGHYRTYASGTRAWVRDTMVNAKAGTPMRSHYVVKSEAASSAE